MSGVQGEGQRVPKFAVGGLSENLRIHVVSKFQVGLQVYRLHSRAFRSSDLRFLVLFRLKKAQDSALFAVAVHPGPSPYLRIAGLGGSKILANFRDYKITKSLSISD